jgi:hypothetical protein
MSYARESCEIEFGGVLEYRSNGDKGRVDGVFRGQNKKGFYFGFHLRNNALFFYSGVSPIITSNIGLGKGYCG